MSLPKLIQKIINNVGYGQTLTDNDNDIVHKTGEETIEGKKTFSAIRKYDDRLEKGVLPSTRTYYSMDFCDKNYATVPDVNGTRLGLLEGYVEPDGSTSFGLYDFKYATNGASASHITCMHDTTNNYGYIDSSPIVNRVNDGSISFQVKHLNRQRTVAPGAKRANVCLSGIDVNGYGLWGLYSVQDTDNRSFIRLIEYNSTTTDAEYAYIEVGSLSDGTLYASAIPTPENSVGREIVTAGWANSKFLQLDNTQQTVLGLKTFTNNIIVKSGSIVSNANPSKTLYSFVQYHSNDDVNVSNAGYAKYPDGDRCYIIYLYGLSNENPSLKRLAFNYDDGTLDASPDNGISLGSPNIRWKQVYAVTTTISTSDERLKDSISLIPDEVLDAWGDVNFVQYYMKDAFAEKGNTARFHSGLIAQNIDSIFKSKNLDVSKYGLFCYDKWDAKDEVLDEDGKLLEEKIDAGDRYSLRYEEALCMEAAYNRRRVSRLEERLLALEQELAELKNSAA